jgi:hypothetical protein
MPIQVVFFPELVNASVKGADCLSDPALLNMKQRLLHNRVASSGLGGHFYLHHDPVFIYKEPGFLTALVTSQVVSYGGARSFLPAPKTPCVSLKKNRLP